MRQKAKYEKSRRDLVRFRCPESLGVGPPPLSIVRLPITRLLESSLKRVSDVGAEIDRLMVRQNVFFSRSKERLVFRDVILGLEVGNEAQNPFWILVLLSVGIGCLTAGVGRRLRRR